MGKAAAEEGRGDCNDEIDRSNSQQQPLDDPDVKVIILGDSAVGKSKLVERYLQDEFNPRRLSTHALTLYRKNINIGNDDDKKVTVDFWDTAGQERFRTLTTNFYRKADGIIVSFDVTDRKTFDGVATWMKAIKEHADAQADLVLCGNKIDLANDRQVSQAEG